MDRKAYVALRKEWAKKLAASGFEDIEFLDSTGEYDSRYLVRNAHHDSISGRSGERTGGAEYFRLAGWWLHDRVWGSRIRKLAWSLHCDGVSVASLVKLLPTKVQAGTVRSWFAAEKQRLKGAYT